MKGARCMGRGVNEYAVWKLMLFKFQSSPQGAQWRSNKWVELSSYRSVILCVAVEAAQHVFHFWSA